MEEETMEHDTPLNGLVEQAAYCLAALNPADLSEV
jgi:hypothetical protein